MKSPSPELEFYNAHLEQRDNGTWQIARYPREVRHQMNDGARRTAIDSCGAEIRCVSDANALRLTISCETNDGEVQVYRGAFLVDTQKMVKGVPTLLELLPPPTMLKATDATLQSGGYAPNLWRVLFARGSYIFHSFENLGYAVRPPKASDSPKIKWLAYGSSITHSHLAGYPYHASRLLHWNVYSKGLSGSCHVEHAATDFLSQTIAEEGIDIITAELGVNMRAWCEVDEFAERAEYFVKTLRAAHPKLPIVLITIFTNSGHTPRELDLESNKRQLGYDAVLRSIVDNANDANLHLIEGSKILADFTLLSSDVLHPTASGHALMGHLLAEHLYKLFPDEPVPPAFSRKGY